MASTTTSEPFDHVLSGLKNKKNRKKKLGGKHKSNGDFGKHIGHRIEGEIEIDQVQTNDLELKTLSEPEDAAEYADGQVKGPLTSKYISTADEAVVSFTNSSQHKTNLTESSTKNTDECDTIDIAKPEGRVITSLIPRFDSPDSLTIDTKRRFDELARERTALRDEVALLRRSLEGIQGNHKEDLSNLRDQLLESKGETEHYETQYRNLLGKVGILRSQLGERLKTYADDLTQARSQIKDLEEQCTELRNQNEARAVEITSMIEEGEQRSKELSSLRNRTTLSQQNWTKEKEDLIQREVFAREEFEAAKQAMQEWEVLAMEERSLRENIAERATDLDEQLLNQREAHEKAASERDSQSVNVDGLQKALQEIQEARRHELRELVENSQAQIEHLQKQLHNAELGVANAGKLLEFTKCELEKAIPFEKEVKEKNLLIGKLRHEAVILNDHLTKALRYLRRGRPEDNIDKQLITNHFLHFLALERTDPKKFQILQIIAALLDWTDEQREQAGLVRPGASNPNLRVPISPWHRTPSTPVLSTDFFPEGGTRKESLAELWSDFLQQEVQEGAKSPSSPTTQT